MYWFCHTSTWIHHRCTRVPHPEPPSLLPPRTIPLGRPSAAAPSIQYRALNLDWRFVFLNTYHVIEYCNSCSPYNVKQNIQNRHLNEHKMNINEVTWTILEITNRVLYSISFLIKRQLGEVSKIEAFLWWWSPNPRFSQDYL